MGACVWPARQPVLNLDRHPADNGDAALVKDYLRACFICLTLNEVCLVWKQLSDLVAAGVIKIPSIKNRYRGAPTAMGYRDM